jgi:hypothetical protein
MMNFVVLVKLDGNKINADKVLAGKRCRRELCGRGTYRRVMNVLAKSVVNLGSWLTTRAGMGSCAHCIP